jgi:hypothetical protein
MTNNGDGWYTYTFNSATAATIIFNDGTNQSVDSYRDKDGWYMNGTWYDTKPSTPPVVWTVYFYKPTNYGSGINIYWYNALPSGALPSPSWPGVPMTNDGDGWYSYTFTNIASAVVIFNDGTNQTADLPRDATGWYYNGAWYDTQPATTNATGSKAVSMSSTAETNGSADINSLQLTSIYPNPAKENFFHVFVPGLKNNELATITVLDANGKTVLKTQTGQTGLIHYSFHTGVYFVRINATGINVTKKLIVE